MLISSGELAACRLRDKHRVATLGVKDFTPQEAQDRHNSVDLHEWSDSRWMPCQTVGQVWNLLSACAAWDIQLAC